MGNSGLKLTEITFGSALTIGTENCEQNYVNSMIDCLWSYGVRSFDVANSYGNGNAEIMLSTSLARYSREEYVYATKISLPVGGSVYHKGLSRKHILWAFDSSFERAKEIEYIDILYAHRYDNEVSMEEIVRTFNYLINTGKVRYWATSEWPVEALIECHAVCEKLGMEKPILEQSIYSYAVRKIENNGIKRFAENYNIGLLGYSPLCQGFLTGKYRNSIPEKSRIAKSKIIDYDKTKNFYKQYSNYIDYFLDICQKYNVKPNHVAILWNIRNGVYPILGSSNISQIEDNMEYLNSVISDDVWQDLENFKAE